MSSFITPVIGIIGPTASGKTKQAVILAKALSGEIVSADSRQVFKGMDIGTGKDISDYGEIPYHMIDVAEAGDVYDLHRYLIGARKAVTDIISRDKLPIVCGGSGLYIEALLKGTQLPDVPANPELRKRLEPMSQDELNQILASLTKLHNTTDTQSSRRTIRAIEIQTYYKEHPELAPGKNTDSELPHILLALEIDRETRNDRIDRRLDARLAEGMIDEINGLITNGVSVNRLIGYGLEYKYVTLYLTGQLRYDEMRQLLAIAIHQFAKRQGTWIRGMERRGLTVNYIPYDIEPEQLIDKVKQLISNCIR